MCFVRVIVLLSLVMFCGACVTTRMQPVKQHRHLESSGAVSFDYGGDGAYPRGDILLMLGLFDVMDVSTHLGTTGLSYFAGAGTRFYPTSWLTLSSQLEYRYGDYISWDLDTDVDEEYADAHTYRGVWRPTFQYYGRHGGLYIGPQAVLHHVQFSSQRPDLTQATLGWFLGAEYKFGGFGAMQVELSAWQIPLYDSTSGSEDKVYRSFGRDYFLSHYAQFSFGFTMYFQEFADAWKRL